MLRPLMTLALGVLLAVAAAVAISPTYTWREAILPVLITAGLGSIVLGATARRASLRDKAQALIDAEHAAQSPAQHDRQIPTATPDAGDTSTASTASERPDSDQETDRG